MKKMQEKVCKAPVLGYFFFKIAKHKIKGKKIKNWITKRLKALLLNVLKFNI